MKQFWNIAHKTNDIINSLFMIITFINLHWVGWNSYEINAANFIKSLNHLS